MTSNKRLKETETTQFNKEIKIKNYKKILKIKYKIGEK